MQETEKTLTWLKQMGLNPERNDSGITMHSNRILALYEVDILWGALKRKGLDEKKDVDVRLIYSPRDEKCVIHLFGVNDGVLT